MKLFSNKGDELGSLLFIKITLLILKTKSKQVWTLVITEISFSKKINLRFDLPSYNSPYNIIADDRCNEYYFRLGFNRDLFCFVCCLLIYLFIYLFYKNQI